MRKTIEKWTVEDAQACADSFVKEHRICGGCHWDRRCQIAEKTNAQYRKELADWEMHSQWSTASALRKVL